MGAMKNLKDSGYAVDYQAYTPSCPDCTVVVAPRDKSVFLNADIEAAFRGLAGNIIEYETEGDNMVFHYGQNDELCCGAKDQMETSKEVHWSVQYGDAYTPPCADLPMCEVSQVSPIQIGLAAGMGNVGNAGNVGGMFQEVVGNIEHIEDSIENGVIGSRHYECTSKEGCSSGSECCKTGFGSKCVKEPTCMIPDGGNDFGICPILCGDDIPCDDDKKCCQNACGGTQCVKPETLTALRRRLDR